MSPPEARGCASLAVLYQEGIWGFKKDIQQAKLLYKKACDRFDKNSDMRKIYCRMGE